MAGQDVTMRVKLAWWFMPLVVVLAPLGWFGLRLPRRLVDGIAQRAARTEVV